MCHAHSWFYGGIIYLYWFLFGCELILDFIFYFRLPALGSICLIALLLSCLEVWEKWGPCSVFLFAVCPYSFPKTASLLSVNAWSQNNSILVLVINRWPETNVNPSVLRLLWYSNTEAGGDISGSYSLAGLSCKRSVYAPLLRSSDLDSVVKTNSKLEALYCDYATRSCGIGNEQCLPRLPPSTERRDQGQNRRAGRPQVWHVGEHMLGNKHHRHHSLSLKMGFWQGQRKALSPPRYLTRVWTPRVSVRRRGACSCHRGSSLFTGPSSSEKSRGRFSAGGHKSQAGEQQVWGCSEVGFCGGGVNKWRGGRGGRGGKLGIQIL